MARGKLKKTLLSVAVVAMAAGAAAPAQAGKGRYHHGGWSHHSHVRVYHHAGPRYYHPGPRYYYGTKHYRVRHHHHRRGLSGGEAALIALGIVGGVVLIDRALEAERARRDYAYDPYYAPPPPPRGDHYYRRDDRPAPPRYDDDYGYDDLDDELLGGPESYPQSHDGRRYNYGAAYNDCKAETRQAAGDGGLVVALPAKPQSIHPIEGGAAVRFEADFLASDRRGGEWRRTMVCEADEAGVRFLELV